MTHPEGEAQNQARAGERERQERVAAAFFWLIERDLDCPLDELQRDAEHMADCVGLGIEEL